VQALPSPMRRVMHELGLFSGLRPGSLVSLRREWIDLENQGISIPRERMKSRRDFALPLSQHMVGVVRRALEIGDMLFPGTEWLFPTRGTDGKVKAVIMWRERTLPGETGHVLRHTFRTIAQRAGLDPIEADLLLDHKVQGVRGIYIHERALFDRLLAAQERMSGEILALLMNSERLPS